MYFPNYYDGGSVEIGPSSPPNLVNADCHEGGSENSEYVYIKYRIANKRLSSMEDQITQLKATIDNYAIALQYETQIREICQLALLDEQIRRSGDEDTADYKSQIEHLLAVIWQLQTKIQTMREQHSGELSVAANHTTRAE
jgi:hypothetical protein